MSQRKRTSGMWLIILLFISLALFTLYDGVIFIINPISVIQAINFSTIASVFQINPLDGQPLFGWLSILGILILLLSFLLFVTVIGLLAYKAWSWVITAIISLVLVVAIIGIFLFWIIDNETNRLAYNQA